MSPRDGGAKLNFVSRAINSLRRIRLSEASEGGQDPAPPQNVLQWVLAVWAEQGRQTELPVRGMSMWPLLRSGERIAVRHGGAPPAVGEVVVFLQEQRTIAHRVVATRTRGTSFELRTKGDFTLTVDPGWVGPERLVGVIEGIRRDGAVRRRPGLQGLPGSAIAFASNLQGWLCAPLAALRRRMARRPRAARRAP